MRFGGTRGKRQRFSDLFGALPFDQQRQHLALTVRQLSKLVLQLLPFLPLPGAQFALFEGLADALDQRVAVDGLGKNSQAPCWNARRHRSIVPWPVIRITGSSG